jgi:hypothetical protein
MRSRKVIIIVGLTMLMIFSSCGRPLWKNNFHVYKYNPHERSTVSVPVDGIFFLENHVRTRYWDPPFAFFLYKDGSIVSYNGSGLSNVPEQDFWQNPDEYLKSMQTSSMESGHYRVDGANITIEIFITFVGSFAQWNVIRFSGRVMNDSTISIEKAVCGWCPEKISSFPKNGVEIIRGRNYKFYPTSLKSASSRLWFGNYKWYRKNVWYNKKVPMEVKG